MEQAQELESRSRVCGTIMGVMRGKGAALPFARVSQESVADEEIEDLRQSSLAISGTRIAADVRDTRIAAFLLAGDPHGAIALAARDYGAAIGRLCFLLLGSQSEADEAAQETLIAAYHSARAYRADGTPRAWFYGIARRICAQRVAARLRQSRRLTMLFEDAMHGPDASVLHDNAERDARVRAALDSLAPSDRELLALRYDADQSFRDIADTLGIDEAAARKRVGRALMRMREQLSTDSMRPRSS
jgi:RNA polymerase sigma-70 factor, ECF subfamily